MEQLSFKTKIYNKANIEKDFFEYLVLPNEQHAYYRSQLFEPEIALNPLIACSAALLVINNKLKELSHMANIHVLYQQLVHEINAFLTKAQNRGYPSETILAAQYILCATLDETILTTTWGSQCGWKTHTLLTTFFKDHTNDENFFLFIEGILSEPQRHSELIELAYIVLRLGYQGIYRHSNKEILDSMTDKIYHTVKRTRKDPHPILAVNPQKPVPKKLLVENIWDVKAVTISTMIALLLVALIYSVFDLMFFEIINPIQDQLSNISHYAQIT